MSKLFKNQTPVALALDALDAVVVNGKARAVDAVAFVAATVDTALLQGAPGVEVTIRSSMQLKDPALLGICRSADYQEGINIGMAYAWDLLGQVVTHSLRAAGFAHITATAHGSDGDHYLDVRGALNAEDGNRFSSLWLKRTKRV